MCVLNCYLERAGTSDTNEEAIVKHFRNNFGQPSPAPNKIPRPCPKQFCFHWLPGLSKQRLTTNKVTMALQLTRQLVQPVIPGDIPKRPNPKFGGSKIRINIKNTKIPKRIQHFESTIVGGDPRGQKSDPNLN